MSAPTVLVVDDDDDIRELIKLALQVTSSWNVITANDGAAAIHMARTHRPDAVLMDMMMPRMDGLAAFERMQADEATRNIPVILVTAKGQVGDRQPWQGHSIHGVIPKPFDPTTLAAQVATLLSWPSPR